VARVQASGLGGRRVVWMHCSHSTRDGKQVDWEVDVLFGCIDHIPHAMAQPSCPTQWRREEREERGEMSEKERRKYSPVLTTRITPSDLWTTQGPTDICGATFRTHFPPYQAVYAKVAKPGLIFDGRLVLDKSRVEAAGFTLHRIGASK
jgi:hypothetical protein